MHKHIESRTNLQEGNGGQMAKIPTSDTFVPISNRSSLSMNTVGSVVVVVR
jgi:hypothetical protein